MKFMTVIFLALSISVFSLPQCTSEAQEKSGKKISPMLERGIGQYKHENYDEAIVTLKKARDEDPVSSLAAYYLGLAYKQVQDYKAAVPNLREAVTFRPKIKGALIELIDCLYQVGELEEAETWIREAEMEGIRPAQTSFLKGLVLLKEDKADDAVAAFKNARALDPSMTQACNYQIGIANLKRGKYTDARTAFEEVVIVDPSSNMANFANEYMDAIQKREYATRPFKMSFGGAWQYDSNVVLKPSDTTIASNITDKGDSRQVYTAQAEYEKRFMDDKIGLKGQYMFYYAKQTDLGFYDTVNNAFVVQPSLYLKDGLATFPTSFNYTLVNDKAYLSTPATSGIYNRMFGKSNMGQVYLKYQYRDYLWDPSTPDEDRDGSDFGGGLGWYCFFAKNKGFVSLRYGLNREWTAGCNWGYIGNRVNATLLMPLMENLNATVTGDIYMQNFARSNSIYSVYRKDRVYTVSALVAYKFYKDSEIQLQYTYVNDDSNISVYAYTRDIYSAGVEIKF